MMKIQRYRAGRYSLLAAVAALAMAIGAPAAQATAVRIHFSAPVGSGYADLTLGGTNPADNVYPPHTPVTITDATGMFNGQAITGVRDLAPAVVPDGEKLPASYSLVPVPHENGGGDHDGVTYDNLFYPSGSPVICLVDGTPTFPFGGGFLDLMGVMFTLDNGNLVDLWSFGNVTAPGVLPPFVPLGQVAYGIKLIDTHGETNAVVQSLPFGHASVPEPDYPWVIGAAVFALLVWRRAQARKSSGPS